MSNAYIHSMTENVLQECSNYRCFWRWKLYLFGKNQKQMDKDSNLMTFFTRSCSHCSSADAHFQTVHMEKSWNHTGTKGLKGHFGTPWSVSKDLSLSSVITDRVQTFDCEWRYDARFAFTIGGCSSCHDERTFSCHFLPLQLSWMCHKDNLLFGSNTECRFILISAYAEVFNTWAPYKTLFFCVHWKKGHALFFSFMT